MADDQLTVALFSPLTDELTPLPSFEGNLELVGTVKPLHGCARGMQDMRYNQSDTHSHMLVWLLTAASDLRWYISTSLRRCISACISIHWRSQSASLASHR